MKKKLGKKINLVLSLMIIVVLLPLLVTTICQRMKLENLLSGGLETVAGETEGVEAEGTQAGHLQDGTPDGAGTEAETDTQHTSGAKTDISDVNGAKSDTQETGTAEAGTSDRVAEAEDRVLGIVAKEIAASSSREAILAQSVIARTNLYDAWDTGTAEPEGLELSEMQALWGEDFQKIYQRLRECTAETEGQVLLWNGNYIYAAYHAISAGTTRDISELYEEVDMPYLENVTCQEDATAEGYLGVLYWEKDEFLEKCKKAFPDAAVESIEQITVEKRDTAGYVLNVMVGQKTVTGEEFRDSFALNSACFSITDLGEQVRIVTKGLGHGVGLSQYTAVRMALEGKDYQEILEYFYPGTELGTAEKT
ncbi:MAG: SpoIID/LytB domain-containing protein [Roseburia sp.]|nr:SpoIID/LytB domain-containing protein [Roseburia sp.]